MDRKRALKPQTKGLKQMQKYRADSSKTQPDGATLWFSNWLGGPTLSKINNCRFANLAGNMRGTVYITGPADTFFSIPAATRLFGKYVKGYVTTDDDRNFVFRQVYY